MKFRAIKLENFRQFVETEIHFKGDQSQPFDFVIATNATAKTTLLSSVMFAFHGELLESLGNPELVINNDVFDSLAEDAEASVGVSITFTHGPEQYEYVLRRYTKYAKRNTLPRKVDEAINLTNLTLGVPIAAAEKWIAQNFPKGLAHFLLVPGERLEVLFDPGNLKFPGALERVTNDIKVLTGLDKVEPLIRAVEGVQTKLDLQLRRLSDQPTLASLVDQAAGTRSAIAKQSQDFNTKKQILSDLKSELFALNKTLEGRAADSENLKAMKEVEVEISTANTEKRELSKVVEQFIGEYAWLILFKRFAPLVDKEVVALNASGNLGSHWPKNLLSDLITSETCVCGASLVPGADGHKMVSKQLAKETKFQRPQSYLALRDFGINGALEPTAAITRWQQLQSDLGSVNDLLENLEFRLANLRAEIASSGRDDEIERFISRKEILETSEIPAAENKLAASSAELSTLESNLEDIEEKISEVESQDGAHARLLRQRSAIAKVCGSIRRDAEDFRSNLQQFLADYLNKNLPEMLDDPRLHFEVNTDLTVEIKRNHATHFLNTGGQTNLLAFAFVTGLYLAAQKIGAEYRGSGHDTDLPFLVDAPFSDLGERYTNHAISMLEQSSSQLIILLRPNQAALPQKSIDRNRIASSSQALWLDPNLPDIPFNQLRKPDFAKRFEEIDKDRCVEIRRHGRRREVVFEDLSTVKEPDFE